MSMFLGNWDDFGNWDDNSMSKEQELKKIKQELIDDSPLFDMHMRDFDDEAKEIYESRHRKES